MTHSGTKLGRRTLLKAGSLLLGGIGFAALSTDFVPLPPSPTMTPL